MARIPIWPGSASFDENITPFSFYDSDTSFQADAVTTADWCAKRLGYNKLIFLQHLKKL